MSIFCKYQDNIAQNIQHQVKQPVNWQTTDVEKVAIIYTVWQLVLLNLVTIS